MRLIICFFFFSLVLVLTPCWRKHVENIVLDGGKEFQFISSVANFGSKNNLCITTKGYLFKKQILIDLGDWGERPLLYRVTNKELIIFTNKLEVNIPLELMEYVKHEKISGIKYYNIVDSIEYYKRDGYYLYYPICSIKE